MYKNLFLVFMIILMISTPVYSTEWQSIDYSSPEIIKESGLTIEQFNSLSKSDWLEILKNKEKISFAFSVIDKDGKNITNDINPDLSINVNGLNKLKNITFSKITKEKIEINPEIEIRIMKRKLRLKQCIVVNKLNIVMIKKKKKKLSCSFVL